MLPHEGLAEPLHAAGSAPPYPDSPTHSNGRTYEHPFFGMSRASSDPTMYPALNKNTFATDVPEVPATAQLLVDENESEFSDSFLGLTEVVIEPRNDLS